jgi:hypothetical protein
MWRFDYLVTWCKLMLAQDASAVLSHITNAANTMVFWLWAGASTFVSLSSLGTLTNISPVFRQILLVLPVGIFTFYLTYTIRAYRAFPPRLRHLSWPLRLLYHVNFLGRFALILPGVILIMIMQAIENGLFSDHVNFWKRQWKYVVTLIGETVGSKKKPKRMANQNRMSKRLANNQEGELENSRRNEKVVAWLRQQAASKSHRA